MNHSQRVVVALGLIAILVFAIFPPMHAFGFYASIFTPAYQRPDVETGALIAIWGGIVAICGILVILFRNRDTPP